MKLYQELAPYYFAIENNHRNIKTDVAFILSEIANIHKPVHLLDLGCGTGEHLNLLSRHDFNCTGLDISNEMLTIAKERTDKSINYLKSSMTTFDYYNEFNIITSFFGSFNYMLDDSEIEKTLWNTWRALKPDGLCIFEIWNTLPVKKIKQKDLSLISTTTVQDKTIKRERGFRLLEYPKKDIVEVDYNYTLKSASHSFSLKDKHRMRTFTKEEISYFLNENGFTLDKVYANFNKELYNMYSNKMIIVFRKQ